MTDFILSLIKFSAYYLCGFYSYGKISSIKPNKFRFFDLPAALAFSTVLYFATLKIRILIPLIYFLLSCLYLLIFYRQSCLETVTKTIVACGVTIFLFIISYALATPSSYLAYKILPSEPLRNLITQTIISCLQLIAVFLLFKIKRFKSGISPNIADGNFELLLLASAFCIFLMFLFYTGDIENTTIRITLILIIACGLEAIIWWRKHITNNYQKQVYKRNVGLLEERIKACEDEKAYLVKQNEDLAKIIHRDNKLVPAMAIAVEKLIEKNGFDSESSDKNFIDDLKNLQEQLQALSDEHSKLVKNYVNENETVELSGIISLDAVLEFLHSKARQNNIDCDIMIDRVCIRSLKDIIDPTDLNTLLCDLGENAIIAVKGQTERKIGITFGCEQEIAYIAVHDSGPFFDDKVINFMGRKKITTHKTDGGNGIGLMTIFEILRKYNASFYIDEKPSEQKYNKSVKIMFDGCGNFLIVSDRESAIKAYNSRN